MFAFMKWKIRRDRFYRKRGATAQILVITCSRCGEYICNYQKDGNGNLHRLYLDRILHNSSQFCFTDDSNYYDIKQLKNMICRCSHLLAVPMLYKKEQRPAYRIIKGSIHKKAIP